MWCQKLPGLVLRNPGSPQTRKVVHWLKGGEWALLNLLLLTRQSAGHGAVEPKRNELPSFRERRGLSIVPIKSPTGPRLLLDSTALHALLDAGLLLILKLNCTRCRGRVSVVPKVAWVSPTQPRLPSDLKSRPTGHCLTSRRGGCWKGIPPLGQGGERSGASPGHPPPGTLNDLPLILVAPYEKD